ncbi:ankyrin, partial [Aspergillus campestris IBT 28561]
MQQLIPRPDVDVNLQGFCRPPLVLAILQGDTDTAKLLLARGADLHADALDFTGRTPLACAAECGHTEIVQLLLERSDVDPHRVDSDRLTPLLHAIAADKSDVVMMLLRRGDAVCCSFDLVLHSPAIYCAVLEHPEWLALWPRCDCLGCGYYHLNDPAYVSRPDWKQYVRDYYL